jgi:uncharacterized repeat protein (TIGR01451 family)
MNRTEFRAVLTLLTVLVLLLGSSLAASGSPPALTTPTPTPVGQESTPIEAPAPPSALLPPGASAASYYDKGFIPPAIDLPHLTGQRVSASGTSIQALPSSWDWRDTSKVTSVKNQSTCGACYAFASVGNIESKLLIDGAGTYNLSENNAKECNWRELNNFQDPPGTPWGSCDGGNYFMMANLFSKKGTVLETDDPYVVSDVSCNSSVTYQKTLLDWRVISSNAVPDATVLKQYIYDNGPVYTTLYVGNGDAWETEFGTYDGSYTLYHAGTESTNHAVLIVGWDDSLTHTGGSGGWIVKNSWGTGWGSNGYFTIAYGSASIGSYSSYMHDWQDYDSIGDLWYYDDDGWTNNWTGCSPANVTSWGLAKFIPISNTNVTRVEFWTNDATTDVDVYLYDDFDGSSLSGLLAQKPNSSFNEAGYHSVALDSPVAVSSGDDVVAVVKVTNQSFQYPIVADKNGSPETGRTYISCNSTSWTDLGTYASEDVGIRVRTNSTPSPNVSIYKQVVGSDFEPGDPITFTLSIANNGSKIASNVLVTDSLPSEVLTPTVASTLDITATGSISYVWEVEPLAIGGSGVITITGRIDPGLGAGFSFDNNATISDPEDNTPNNNSSSVTIEGSATIYLPIVLKNFGSSGGIVNGDFESGPTDWVEYSTHGWDLIVQALQLPGTVTPHSGNWAVWLGGEYDDISYIQQQVNVPTGNSYLAYWHWIASEDACGYDFGGVLVNSTVVDVYNLCIPYETGGWVKHVVNLGSYAGQTVLLQIRAETDSSLNSNLFVDDVAFQASATSAHGIPIPFNARNARARPGTTAPSDSVKGESIDLEFLLRPTE